MTVSRKSNAGEPGDAGYFETTKVDEMAAYDGMSPMLRRAIDQCVHEYSALQVKQMMDEREISDADMTRIINSYNRQQHEKLEAMLPEPKRKTKWVG